MAVPIRPPANSESNARAPQTRQDTSQETSEAMPHDALLDHYSVLLKAISDASADPAQLRKLVYTMACHDIRPDDALAAPIPNTTKRARTILELEQALQLERAIKRLESQSAQLPGTRGADAPQAVYSAPPDVAYPGAIADAAPREMFAEAPIQEPYALRLGFKSSLQLGAATASGISLFLGVAVFALFVLRAREPNADRPFKALGYPIAPAIFTIACFVILANALYTDLVKPITAGTPVGPSAWGFLVIGLGLPIYYFFARKR